MGKHVNVCNCSGNAREGRRRGARIVGVNIGGRPGPGAGKGLKKGGKRDCNTYRSEITVRT